MLPSTLWSYFTTWLTFSTPTILYNDNSTSNEYSEPKKLTFELRHLHAQTGKRVLFADVPTGPAERDPLSQSATIDDYTIRTRSVIVHSPRSHELLVDAQRRSRIFGESTLIPWDPDEVDAPDIESRETLLLLAKMTYNAYIEPTDKEWYELGEEWPEHFPFGWEPDEDGFRGYVFATPDNSTVILSIKGTSAGVFGGGGPTSKKDKLNDNLLFSCCCGYVDWSWTPVCGCHSGGWNCDISCVQEALIEESLFYPIGTNLYYNLTRMYPDANIWAIGHSLGGALASLIGVTFGVPVVAFESPGEKMASQRLHLPQPPSTQHITHVYHTADPIAMGTCNGVFSSCALGGYAMESRCHLGKSIVYDTIGNQSWSSNVRTHTISTVIDRLLSVPWPPAVDAGREVPESHFEEDCVECYSWEFGDYKNKNISTFGSV